MVAAAAACAPPPPEDALAAPMLLLLLLLVVLLFALLAAGATGAAAAERDAIKGQLPGAARLGGRRPWTGFARLRYVTLAFTYAKQGYPRSFFSGTRIKWRRSEFPGPWPIVSWRIKPSVVEGRVGHDSGNVDYSEGWGSPTASWK